MRRRNGLCLMLAAPVCLSSAGCITTSVIVATKLIGSSVDDADAQATKTELVGQDRKAADKALGKPVEILADVDRSDRSVLVYPVKGDTRGTMRYVVEMQGQRIVAVEKKQQDTQAVRDVLEKGGWKAKLMGKSAAECEELAELGKPVEVLRSQQSGQLVRVYDLHGKAGLGSARYGVLRFGRDDRCESVNLIGVAADRSKSRG